MRNIDGKSFADRRANRDLSTGRAGSLGVRRDLTDTIHRIRRARRTYI
jgi:hypothetical protein